MPMLQYLSRSSLTKEKDIWNIKRDFYQDVYTIFKSD